MVLQRIIQVWTRTAQKIPLYLLLQLPVNTCCRYLQSYCPNGLVLKITTSYIQINEYTYMYVITSFYDVVCPGSRVNKQSARFKHWNIAFFLHEKAEKRLQNYINFYTPPCNLHSSNMSLLKEPTSKRPGVIGLFLSRLRDSGIIFQLNSNLVIV